LAWSAFQSDEVKWWRKGFLRLFQLCHVATVTLNDVLEQRRDGQSTQHRSSDWGSVEDMQRLTLTSLHCRGFAIFWPRNSFRKFWKTWGQATCVWSLWHKSLLMADRRAFGHLNALHLLTLYLKPNPSQTSALPSRRRRQEEKIGQTDPSSKTWQLVCGW